MDTKKFRAELAHIGQDSITEHEFAKTEFNLTLNDVRHAFMALKAHAKEEGDLFIDTEAPTDDALLLIFAFLVLP